MDYDLKRDKEPNVKLVAGFLASALDMEDHMSLAAYGEFLNRGIWGDKLDDELFNIVKEQIDTLVKETEEHKQAFLNLQRKLGQNNGSQN